VISLTVNIKIIAMDFEDAVSVYADDAVDLQYEQCPHCSRSFFQGKLKLHLKLCNPISPMLKSPRKTPKLQINEPGGEAELRCEKCNMKLPAFLKEKHLSRCGV
jgi:protein-arginine kinase activator protein McsA